MIVVVKDSRVMTFIYNYGIDDKDKTIRSGWLLFFIVNSYGTHISMYIYICIYSKHRY